MAPMQGPAHAKVNQLGGTSVIFNNDRSQKGLIMNTNVNTLDREFGLCPLRQNPSLLRSIGNAILSLAIGLENAREMQIKVEEGVPPKTAFKSVYGIDLSR